MKMLKVLTIVFLILAMLPTYAHALSDTKTEVIEFEDGSYMVIEVTSIDARSATTRTATKTYRYYNALGTEKWYITLIGTFTYDGTTSVCLSSNTSIGIFDSAWYIISNQYSTSGNTAIGNVIMGFKILGVTTDRKTVDMTLTCDANGNLS